MTLDNFIELDFGQETRQIHLKTDVEHTYFITARLWNLRTRICKRDQNYYLVRHVTGSIFAYRFVALLRNFLTGMRFVKVQGCSVKNRAGTELVCSVPDQPVIPVESTE